MLIEALLNLLYNLLDILLFFEIPNLPTDVNTYLDMMFEYLVTGASIFANYAPLDYLLTLFGIIVAVDVGIIVYHFVMWILKKIPMLGIE